MQNLFSQEDVTQYSIDKHFELIGVDHGAFKTSQLRRKLRKAPQPRNAAEALSSASPRPALTADSTSTISRPEPHNDSYAYIGTYASFRINEHSSTDDRPPIPTLLLNLMESTDRWEHMSYLDPFVFEELNITEFREATNRGLLGPRLRESSISKVMLKDKLVDRTAMEARRFDTDSASLLLCKRIRLVFLNIVKRIARQQSWGHVSEPGLIDRVLAHFQVRLLSQAKWITIDDFGFPRCMQVIKGIHAKRKPERYPEITTRKRKYADGSKSTYRYVDEEAVQRMREATERRLRAAYKRHERNFRHIVSMSPDLLDRLEKLEETGMIDPYEKETKESRVREEVQEIVDPLFEQGQTILGLSSEDIPIIAHAMRQFDLALSLPGADVFPWQKKYMSSSTTDGQVVKDERPSHIEEFVISHKKQRNELSIADKDPMEMAVRNSDSTVWKNKDSVFFNFEMNHYIDEYLASAKTMAQLKSTLSACDPDDGSTPVGLRRIECVDPYGFLCIRIALKSNEVEFKENEAENEAEYALEQLDDPKATIARYESIRGIRNQYVKFLREMSTRLRTSGQEGGQWTLLDCIQMQVPPLSPFLLDVVRRGRGGALAHSTVRLALGTTSTFTPTRAAPTPPSGTVLKVDKRHQDVLTTMFTQAHEKARQRLWERDTSAIKRVEGETDEAYLYRCVWIEFIQLLKFGNLTKNWYALTDRDVPNPPEGMSMSAYIREHVNATMTVKGANALVRITDRMKEDLLAAYAEFKAAWNDNKFPFKDYSMINAKLSMGYRYSGCFVNGLALGIGMTSPYGERVLILGRPFDYTVSGAKATITHVPTGTVEMPLDIFVRLMHSATGSAVAQHTIVFNDVAEDSVIAEGFQRWYRRAERGDHASELEASKHSKLTMPKYTQFNQSWWSLQDVWRRDTLNNTRLRQIAMRDIMKRKPKLFELLNHPAHKLGITVRSDGVTLRTDNREYARGVLVDSDRSLAERLLVYRILSNLLHHSLTDQECSSFLTIRTKAVAMARASVRHYMLRATKSIDESALYERCFEKSVRSHTPAVDTLMEDSVRRVQAMITTLEVVLLVTRNDSIITGTDPKKTLFTSVPKKSRDGASLDTQLPTTLDFATFIAGTPTPPADAPLHSSVEHVVHNIVLDTQSALMVQCALNDLNFQTYLQMGSVKSSDPTIRTCVTSARWYELDATPTHPSRRAYYDQFYGDNTLMGSLRVAQPQTWSNRTSTADVQMKRLRHWERDVDEPVVSHPPADWFESPYEDEPVTFMPLWVDYWVVGPSYFTS